MDEPRNSESMKDNKKLNTQQYDLVRIQRIVEALDFLRREARETGCEEVYTMIESSFNIIFSTYYLILREKLSEEIRLTNAKGH
ncbi:MAG: hypothetical protein HYU57_00750 [Micavibrio aeruginosavorus]|nr:hypothetical protein [Micavibrio aeruginosavorus]